MTEKTTGAREVVLDMEAGRRAFLKSIGFGAAGLALAGSAAGLATPALAASVSDTQILNFALNLEYLEAEFYLRSIGSDLGPGDVTGVGTPGSVLGGRPVPFDKSGLVYQYAREIAVDELHHVRFLRAALGDSKVARPAINIDGAFATAAEAAGLGPGFDAYANENNFLLAAFIFEDVGVTAYKGAARLLESKEILEAAAGILAVEAYHAGNIRTVLAARGLFSQANAISNLRDSVDGPSDRDQGLGSAQNVNIVPANVNSIAYRRNASQVLRVVYLGADQMGGFFPQGLNGAIRTVDPSQLD